MKTYSFLSLSAGSFVLASAFLLFAGAAPAQVFGSHDSNAPVNFNAGRIEVQDRADRVVLSGAVRVEQAGLTLNAARMTVAYRSTGGIEIDRIDASGGVTIRKAGDTASGNVAIYDLNRRLITLIGNVTLTQGTNRLSGGRVIIDLESGRSTIDGRSTGGASVGSQNSSGRVSGTFTVPQRKD
ncbi:LptA/OstA family protein [Sphingorhabdus sp. 109]|jgi:lipopolysaccharide export system protein LptA|uniref:LptA/OstA family protein n=1 Tax=Sphingorhabdus sp. 109 TaxID=2653173 RepID=UPI0012F23A70|nr:LptA/OstA family protein [Sphingorhabdus sp. 109]VWX60597.1 Lipopolysaccharide export system protein LptA [Sphingorhabdus sp. 109]